MKSRIKEIRKAKKLTQRAYADKLNVSKSTIEAIEYGRREATDRIIADICREFNVNEEWLRTGEGDMFNPKTRAQEIAEITKKILKNEEDDFIYKVNMAFLSLSAEQLETLKDFIKKIAN